MSRYGRRATWEAYDGYDTELRTPSYISRGSSRSSLVPRQPGEVPRRRRRHSIAIDSRSYPISRTASCHDGEAPKYSGSRPNFHDRAQRARTKSPPIAFYNYQPGPGTHSCPVARPRRSFPHDYLPRFGVADRLAEPEQRNTPPRSSSSSSRRSSSRHDSGYDHLPPVVEPSRTVRFTSSPLDVGFEDPYTAAPPPSEHLRSDTDERRSTRHRPRKNASSGHCSARPPSRSTATSPSSRDYMAGRPYPTFVAEPQPSADSISDAPDAELRSPAAMCGDPSQSGRDCVEAEGARPKPRRREGRLSLLAAFKEQWTRGREVSVASVRLPSGTGVDIVEVLKNKTPRQGRGRRRNEVGRLVVTLQCVGVG